MALDELALDLPAGARGSTPPAAASQSGLALLLAAVIAVAAVVQQVTIGLDTDVSWLITVGERMLAGDRLYVGIFELNPPASILIYLPGIILAHGLGIRPEAVTAALTFLLAGLACAGAARVLVQSGLCSERSVRLLLPLAAFLFLALPGASFAQREHIATLTLLPMIAVSAARAEGRDVTALSAVLAGLGAGITACIKPHFLLAVLPLILFAAWRRRSVAPLLKPEAVMSAAVVALYGPSVLLLFPEYLLSAVPLIESGYLQARAPLADLLTAPAFLLFLIPAAATLFVEDGRPSSTAASALLAAAGFAAAMLVQGKGYANHLYPALALALLALGQALLADGKAVAAARGRIALATLALAGTVGTVLFANATTYPELTRTVENVAPPHPTILVAGSNLAIGHPLTRWVRGSWAGTRGSLWATATARELLGKEADPVVRQRLLSAIAEDRRLWLSDLAGKQPDVVLADDGGREWIARDPGVRRALASYRVAGAAEGITVLIRVVPRSVEQQPKRGVGGQPDQAQGR